MAKVNLGELISPLFWLSRPLGLMPITHKNGQFVISNGSKFYSMCVTSVCFCLGAIHLFQLFWWAAKEAQAGENILDLFVNSIVYIFTLLNIFYVQKCCAKLCVIFQQLDALLKILAFEEDVKRALRQIRILTIFVQISTFTLLVFYEFHAIFPSTDWLTAGWRVAEKVSRVMCVGGITSTGTHFCALCLVLRCLLKALNAEMKSWIETCAPFLTFKNGKQHHVHRTCSHRMVVLRFCYGKLAEISSQLNSIYSIYILLSLTYHNAYFQLEAFDTLRNAYITLVYKVVFDPGHLRYYFWVFIDGSKILMYFIAVTLYTSDVKHLKINLCLFTNALSSGKLRESVHCFSLEVAATNMNMTALDFFNITWELLFSSAAACTVNIAILMQSYIVNLSEERVSLNKTNLVSPIV